jgi:taurine dioxygenase
VPVRFRPLAPFIIIMKTKPLDYCGVEIVDIDITNLTKSDYEEINEIFLQELIVVFRNQPRLSVPYAKIVSKVGKIANWAQARWDVAGNIIRAPNSPVPDPFTYTGLDHLFPIQRVTGQIKNGRSTGIFGQGKLDWHSNMNGPFNRARGVALQGVSDGIINTSTSFMDTTKAYEAMSDELKARCEGVIGRFEYAPEVWAEGLPEDQYAVMLKNKEEFYEMPLINKSFRGKTGLYFHYLNKCSFPSDLELLEILKEHCFQKQFIYKHEWRPGDIILMDQVLTLHKRDQDDPAILAERVLSRYTFNFPV